MFTIFPAARVRINAGRLLSGDIRVVSRISVHAYVRRSVYGTNALPGILQKNFFFFDRMCCIHALGIKIVAPRSALPSKMMILSYPVVLAAGPIKETYTSNVTQPCRVYYDSPKPPGSILLPSPRPANASQFVYGGRFPSLAPSRNRNYLRSPPSLLVIPQESRIYISVIYWGTHRRLSAVLAPQYDMV